MQSIKSLMALVDSLNIGFYLDAYKLTEEDFTYLETLKQRARDEGFNAIEPFEFKGKFFTGITSAKNIYAYVLINNDVTVKIARKLSQGTYPEIFIEYRSRLLLGGLKDAYLIVKEWVESWADIEREKVSRADITVDFQGQLKINIDDVVMRCRNNGEYYEAYRDGRRLTGYRFGSAALQCRIYDKTVEIEKSGKLYLKEEWKKQGWDEETEVWRVEFQLRRDMLKEFQVETLQNLIDHAPDIWRYLTAEWLTVRQPSRTDKTRSRWELTKTWKIVVESFKGFGILTGIVRENIKDVTVDRLVPQLAGLCTSFAALTRKERIPIYEILKRAEAHIKRKGKTTKGIIEEKMQRYSLFEETYSGLQEV
ncbi:MAG: hypothetical protein ACLQF0_07670 [Dissulfurispiraceae bacterium]